MLIKQKSPSLLRNLALETFGKLLIVFSTEVNLLFLLYSVARRSCLLHMITQNYLLKILKTQVTLYLLSLLELIWNCIIFLTPKMVKKVKTNLHLSKVSWLYTRGSSKELWTWNFIITSKTLQYVPEGVLISRLLEGLNGGPCV